MIEVKGNRYGDKVALEHVEANTYKLTGSYKRYRIIEKEGSVIAIDPSGGPYIGLGFETTAGRVKRIRHEEPNTVLMEIAKD